MGWNKIRILGMAILGAFLFLLPSVTFGQCGVYIGSTSFPTIQAAINSVAGSYTTINVSGTCQENLFISELRDYLTLVGPATIIGSPDVPVIQTLGKGTGIKKLIIRGGFDGIQVIRGGTAFIEDNTILENERSGVVLAMNSYAHIVNNTVQYNLSDGILITDNSNARIGVKTHTDTAALPNTIQGNGYGVTVASSSSALIIGNTIMGNTYDGVRIAKVSQADISNNTINANGREGILVTQNSGVNLGRDTGTTIFDQPNTTTVANGGKGLRCSTGGYVDGRLGSLEGAGNHSATSFTKDCINSLVH